MGSRRAGVLRNLGLYTGTEVVMLRRTGPRTMSTGGRVGVAVTAVTVAVSFLTVCVAGASAASTSSSSTSSGSWAYGSLKTVSAHGSQGTLAYEVSRTIGFAVVLAQTTGPHGEVNVSVNRTMGILLSVEFCRPDCRHPAGTTTIDYHAWESVAADLQFDRNASVTVNGSLVPALGLSASSLSVSAGLETSAQRTLAGAVVGTLNLTILAQADARTTLTPALGLVPYNATPGEAWSSNASFAATGAGNWSVSASATGTLGSAAGHANGTISVAHSGTVVLTGHYLGGTVSLGGGRYDALNLSLAGPFVLREGFLLVPSGPDLFGSGSPSWVPHNDANSSANVSVSQTSVDVTHSLESGSHLGLAASAIRLSYGARTLGLSLPLPSPLALAPTFSPAAGPSAAPNATYVQGSPESVGQATTDQHCLATGLGCPAAGQPPRLLGLLVLAVAGGVAAVLIGIVVVERRKPPAPVYPNAALYPPGQRAQPLGRRADRPEPPADDDPLGHLW